MVHIRITQATITIYNSLEAKWDPSLHSAIVTLVKDLTSEEFVETWAQDYGFSSPPQRRPLINCGIFACLVATLILLGRPNDVHLLSEENMDDHRDQLAWYLVQAAKLPPNPK